MTEPSSYIESGKWDEQTIDRIYENQLDCIGDILDRIQLSGCGSLFDSKLLLKVVKRLLELMEKELLFQWKIKQDGGLAKLFERQKKWLNHELRLSDGLFATWNIYCALIWERLTTPAVLLNQDPWKATVLEILLDRQSYSIYPGFFNSNLWEQNLGGVCSLFEKLYGLSPYHQVLSFLNLVEIGTGDRPQICNPGEADPSLQTDPLPSTMDTFFSDLIDGNRWQEMPERLSLFWEKNSGGDFSLYPAFVIKKTTEDNCFLKGVQSDPQTQLDDQFGTDDHMPQLSEKIESLLAGESIQHVLLWGDGDTSESNSVNRLLTQFAKDGLRLVDIRHCNTDLIDELPGLLEGKKEMFILYTDDFNFEKGESGSIGNPSGRTVQQFIQIRMKEFRQIDSSQKKEQNSDPST